MRLGPVIIAFGLLNAARSYPDNQRKWSYSDWRAGAIFKRQSGAAACPVPQDVTVTAPKGTPFVPLSQPELESIVEWLGGSSLGLNLSDPSSSTLAMSDNYISHIEILKPNKTDVTSYLSGDTSSVPRYARVVINEGAAEVPGVVQYYVGPLPISDSTTMRPLDYFYNGPNGPKVLYSGGLMDEPRHKAVDAIVTKTMTSIADITLNLTGLAYYGSDDNRTNAEYFVQNPYSTDGTTGVIWLPWRRRAPNPWDQPSDLYVSFDIAGTDASLYHLRMIVYNLVVYNSTDDFRAAWSAGEITKTPNPTTDDSFLDKDRTGSVRDLEDRFAPTVLTLDGNRYRVDNTNKYLTYMGWSFYTRFDKDVGIQFYDIRFKGESVLYELSLQDALVQYSGNNPFQTGTAYSDRFYGIGAQAVRPIPGYDCPYHATYWNATFNDGTILRTIDRAICIFETDIGAPLTRHNVYNQWEQSTKGSKLVVRMIATLGNYDYIWDYGFWVDGSITVDARASGYVQANYYRPDDNGRWGPRIGETISGTMHTHVMNFKADFDIVDTSNSFRRTELIVENITQPWYPERGVFESMRYDIGDIPSESGGLLTSRPTDRLNAWGEPRGYRIMPGLSNVYLPSRNSPFFLKSGEHAKQAFAVSRQHDTEPASMAALSGNFFADDESLVQEDLVVWANLGMHHFVRAEDLPNTLTSQAHASLMLAPQNWAVSDGGENTRDLANAVIYHADDDTNGAGQVVPETNGVEAPSCLLLRADDELVGVFEDQS
ncbi:copper amine oxidase [Apiospora saccharicola]